MSTEPEGSRKPRADATRNRDRLLDAARAVFAPGGTGSLEAVARRAGVGIGTLYRHFPTRHALFEALYRREVELLDALADRLAAENLPPLDALRRWCVANTAFVATKKAMLAVLVQQAPPELTAFSVRQLSGALGRLMARAEAANAIRPGVPPEDLLRALVGLCLTQDGPGWQDRVGLMADLLLDGLRPR